jgi:hypothetical protein
MAVSVRRDWDLAYDGDDVLRSQGADPGVLRGRRPELADLADRALELGRPLVRPAALTRRLRVASVRHDRILLEGGATLSGPLVVEHLAGAETIVVMLCTIGSALEEEARRVSGADLGWGLALDAVGSAAVYALSAAVCNVVELQAAAAGLQTSLPLSPGMEGWDVDPGQRELFALIDPEPVGVALSPGMEMHPLKSTSSVIGVGAGLAGAGSVCDYCSLRETCRHRIAEDHAGVRPAR